MFFTFCRLSWHILVVIFGVISGSLFAQSKNDKDRLFYADSVLHEGMLRKDSSAIAEAYYMYGKVENFRFNFKKSTEWYYKSLNIVKKRGDSFELGRLYLRLAENDAIQENYDDCLTQINEGIQVFKRINSEKGLLIAYAFLGDVYRKYKQESPKDHREPQINKAISYLKQAENLAIKLNDSSGLAQTRHTLANCYIIKKDTQAIYYLKSVIKIYEAKNLAVSKAKAMLDLVEVYLDLKRLNESYDLLKKTENFIEADVLQDYAVLMRKEELFSAYYLSVQSYKYALERHQKRDFYMNKLLTADREGAVSRLNIEYKTQEKQALLEKQRLDLVLKEQNLKLQKRFLFVVGILFVFALSLIFFLYKLNEKNNQISKRNAILVQEQNHRVKNNLQVVSSLLRLQANQIEDNKARQAVDESLLRIESMAILHRQLYENDQPDVIDMELFITQLSSIIFRSYGLYNVETDFHIKIPALQVDKAIYLGLMINELVSNVCKYAFVNQPEPLLEILLVEEKKEVFLKVKDNGNTGFSRKEKNGSFGLKLIDMMVQQLNGKAEELYNNGFEFNMRFKL